jgi:hypothetical protein
MTTDWTTEVRSPAEEKDFSSSLCIQTSSEAHPASYPIGIRGSFPGGKARSGRDADHSAHLVPRSRMSRSYTSSPPWRLHGVAGQLYFLFEWKCRYHSWPSTTNHKPLSPYHSIFHLQYLLAQLQVFIGQKVLRLKNVYYCMLLLVGKILWQLRFVLSWFTILLAWHIIRPI